MPDLAAFAGEAMATGLLALGGAVAKLWHSNKKLQRSYNKMAHYILGDFQMFSEISGTVIEAFGMTSAERFLILAANNGERSPDYASVIYEKEKNGSMGAIRRYRKVPVDRAYRSMLLEAELNGWVRFCPAESDPCLLKEIYESDGVTDSVIVFLRRVNLKQGSDRIFYCSIATRADGGFTDRERTIVTNYASAVRDIMDGWL